MREVNPKQEKEEYDSAVKAGLIQNKKATMMDDKSKKALPFLNNGVAQVAILVPDLDAGG